MDLVERQKAIDAIYSVYDKYGRTAKVEEIASAIQWLPSAQSAQHWIPCSERLPTEGETVVLCDRYENMTFGRLIRTDEGYKWDVGSWWNDIDDWNAWMPIEPYKGEAS